MITKERKIEIMQEIEYYVNHTLDKQGFVSLLLEDLASEEYNWYCENCEGRYTVSCGDFKE